MQTARGASLNPSGDTHSPRSTYLRLFILVALLVLVVDQATKALAVATLKGEDSIELIPHVLALTYMTNGGAAFGMGAGMTVVLTALAAVVCFFVARTASQLRDRGWAVGLGLFLGGALGNLIDRVFRDPAPFKGHVVDFLDYGIFIGNVADIALTLAAAMIFFLTWRGVGIDGTR